MGLIMRFCIDYPFKGVIIVANSKGISYGIDAPIRVVRCGHGISNWVDKSRIPLSAKTRSSGSGGFRYPFIILQILGDAHLTRLSRLDFVIDPLHQPPAIGNVAVGI